MRRTILLPLFGAVLALAAGAPADEKPTARGNADTAAVVKGNNEFAFDLYARLRSKKGNLFFSPYSVSTALAMTYNGARGETAGQMAKTLHFAPETARLNAGFAGIMDALNAGKDRPYQLTTANALWAQKEYPFRPAFVKTARDSYHADCEEVDFAQNTEKSRRAINAWVEKKTQDKIKELFKAGVLDSDTRLVLTNAIYFKSAWQNPFNKAATRPADFHLTADRKVKNVPLMHQVEEYRYFDGGSFQLLDLPYERGELQMVVLLPKKVDGLETLEKMLTATRLGDWLAQAKVHQVTTYLPKFKVTSEFSLNKELSAMGMPLAFSRQADFSGLTTSQKLFISAVVHKAYVDVNEKGTEAAAATGVAIKPTSAPVSLQKATFRADHPFVFLIRDRKTGSVLFLGRVTDPRK
jgi:serpin B